MFHQVTNLINLLSFAFGVLIGAGSVCALLLVGRFLMNHWKALLIASAVVSALSLAVIVLL